MQIQNNKNSVGFKSNLPVNADLKSLFYAIPKTELHVHLGGAYPKNIVRELIEKEGFSKTEAAQKVAIPDKFERLDKDFIPLYFRIAKIIKTPQDLERVTYEMFKKSAEDNVRYMELKISNQEINPQGLTAGQLGGQDRLDEYRINMCKSILNATKKAEKDYGMKVKYIFTLERHDTPEKTLQDAKFACELARQTDGRFVALDLAGDEYNFPVTMHKDAIKEGLKGSIKYFTPHAGEAHVSGEFTGVESVEKSLELGAHRIGHGLTIVENQNLIKKVRENDVAIEVSPTSNVMLKTVTSYKEHPVRKMLAEGLKVTICTDDPAIFNTKLTKEYEHLYKAGIVKSWDGLKRLVINGVDAAFLPKEEKAELRKEFVEELNLIEKSPYFKRVINKYLTPCHDKLAFTGRKIAKFLGIDKQ